MNRLLLAATVRMVKTGENERHLK